MPAGTPSNDASTPTVNIEGRDTVFPHVLAESKLGVEEDMCDLPL